MSDIKLAFGCRDGRLWHISEVSSGLGCRCTCPGCGEPFVARKGPVKGHHFGHQPADLTPGKPPCEYAPESALHLYAKELIATTATFLAPPIADQAAGELPVTEAWLELAAGDIVPDVTLETSSGRLFAEIGVTNFADAEKLVKVRKLGTLAVEINLRGLAWDASLEQIQHAILVDLSRRVWLYHPLQAESSVAPPMAPALESVPDEVAVTAAAVSASDNHLADWDPAGEQLIEQARRIDAAEIEAMLKGAKKDKTRLYAMLEPAEKLAYHCRLLGLRLPNLPARLNSRCRSNPFVEPPIIWRSGILVRFIASRSESFTVRDVADWCKPRYALHPHALAPVTEGEAAHWQLSYLALAIFRWLAELESMVDVLDSDGWKPAGRVFTPKGRRFGSGRLPAGQRRGR